MVSANFIIIIVVFLIYYFLILFIEKKLLKNPKIIIEKFLSLLLLYAGISIIYFSITGKPFIGDSIESYMIYIFLIGFIAILWAIPNLLEEFSFFKDFFKKNKKKKNET